MWPQVYGVCGQINLVQLAGPGTNNNRMYSTCAVNYLYKANRRMLVEDMAISEWVEVAIGE